MIYLYIMVHTLIYNNLFCYIRCIKIRSFKLSLYPSEKKQNIVVTIINRYTDDISTFLNIILSIHNLGTIYLRI